MLADFSTKPLQGILFRKFRNVILGYDHIDTLKKISPDSECFTLQKRVRNIGFGMTVKSDCNITLSSDERNKKKVTWSDIVKGKSPQ